MKRVGKNKSEGKKSEIVISYLERQKLEMYLFGFNFFVNKKIGKKLEIGDDRERTWWGE